MKDKKKKSKKKNLWKSTLRTREIRGGFLSRKNSTRLVPSLIVIPLEEPKDKDNDQPG